MNEHYIYQCLLIIPHRVGSKEPKEIRIDLHFLPIKGMQISINEDWDNLEIKLVDYSVEEDLFVLHIEPLVFNSED